MRGVPTPIAVDLWFSATNRSYLYLLREPGPGEQMICLIRYFSTLAEGGIVHVDTSKLPQVGATCTRWLPDAGRPDKEMTSKLRDLLPVHRPL